MSEVQMPVVKDGNLNSVTVLRDGDGVPHDGDVALGPRGPVLVGDRAHLLAHLEEVVGVPHHPLEGGAGGEVAGPVGVRVGGVGEEVVRLGRVHLVAGVHRLQIAAGGRVQQVHFAASRLKMRSLFVAKSCEEKAARRLVFHRRIARPFAVEYFPPARYDLRNGEPALR